MAGFFVHESSDSAVDLWNDSADSADSPIVCGLVDENDNKTSSTATCNVTQATAEDYCLAIAEDDATNDVETSRATFLGRFGKEGIFIVRGLLAVLRSLPRIVLRNFARALGIPPCDPSKVSFSVSITARLLQRSTSGIQRAEHEAKTAKTEGKRDSETAFPSSGTRPRVLASVRKKEAEEENRRILLTLSRTALACAGASRPLDDYVKDVARLSLEGVSVGTKYHTREFARDVRFLGARVLDRHIVEVWRKPLGGLGIRSSLAVAVDGVPLGGTQLFGRHGSVVVICFGSVSPHTHLLIAWYATWCLPTAGHGGQAMAQTIYEALTSEPLLLTRRDLRSYLSLISADGAMARGGETRANRGTGAADILWSLIHPDVGKPVSVTAIAEDAPITVLGQLETSVINPIEWDKYHREEIRVKRAIKKNSMAEELLVVLAMADHLFHLGDGRLLLRSAADAVSVRTTRGALPGGARSAAILAREPGDLIRNFRAYAAGVHLRRSWRINAKAASWSETRLVDAGRRLTSVDLIAFALLFRDIMCYVQRPWSLMVQLVDVEPWVTEKGLERYHHRLETWRDTLWPLRQFLQVVVLLAQHATISERATLIRAAFYASPCTFWLYPRPFLLWQVQPWCRSFPALMFALPDLLHEARPQHQAVDLICVVPPSLNDKTCLGPHCQCPSLIPTSNRHRRGDNAVRVRWKRKRCTFPCWVFSPSEGVRPVDEGQLSPIRYQIRDPETRNPLGVDMRNRLRPRQQETNEGRTSRCVVSPVLYQQLADIDRALQAANQFLRDLHSTQLYGAEGVNRDMRVALSRMCVCFDWEFLTRKRATAAHVRAFISLYESLLTILSRTEWPASDYPFERVVHKWPNVDEMGKQYLLLTKRILDAGKVARHTMRNWWEVSGFRPLACQRCRWAPVDPVFSYISCSVT